MAENTKQFFQITEAARACGLSRSTLMRMEERGLLTPLFTISELTDYLEGYIGQEPYRYGVCVPVRKNRAAADAVTLEACRVLSVLYYGDYSGVDEAWLTLGRGGKGAGAEARRRAAGAGHRGAVHGAGDRDAAVLLAAGAAGGGIKGSGRPAVQVSRFCYTNL